MSRSPITSHVLDTATGRPAANLPIELARLDHGDWQVLDEAKTDADGRVANWGLSDTELGYGTYRLRFRLDQYPKASGFYPFADVVFVRQDDRHHHIPLLLSPYGYSTYRGS